MVDDRLDHPAQREHRDQAPDAHWYIQSGTNRSPGQFTASDRYAAATRASPTTAIGGSSVASDRVLRARAEVMTAGWLNGPYCHDCDRVFRRRLDDVNSRIHFGVHWTSDVVMGAAVGSGIALSTRRWWPVRTTDEAQGATARRRAGAAGTSAGIGHR